jgi:hypothetical protein
MTRKNEGGKKNNHKPKTIFRTIVAFLTGHGVKKISVFGSYARAEANPKSDIDIVVEFTGKKTLLDLVGIEQELSEKIGIKVDLLTERAISPYLIDRIKKDMVVIYG